MEGTFKDFTEKYEKVHQLNMITSVLGRMNEYANNISGRFEDDFDCCEDVEDFDISGIEIALDRMRNDIRTLQQYLNI